MVNSSVTLEAPHFREDSENVENNNEALVDLSDTFFQQWPVWTDCTKHDVQHTRKLEFHFFGCFIFSQQWTANELQEFFRFFFIEVILKEKEFEVDKHDQWLEQMVLRVFLPQVEEMFDVGEVVKCLDNFSWVNCLHHLESSLNLIFLL